MSGPLTNGQSRSYRARGGPRSTADLLGWFWLFGALMLVLRPASLAGQQFAGDDQWVAPHGVGTFVATMGERYAQFYAIAALIPESEFNAQVSVYYDDPRGERRRTRRSTCTRSGGAEPSGGL